MQVILVELITPTMALFFSACFVLLWMKSGLGRYILAFAGAYLFSAIGFLIAISLPPDSSITFQASQLAYSIAAACMIWGACDRVKQPPFLKAMAMIYVIAAAMLVAEVIFTQDAGPRLIISNTGYGIMLLVGVISLLSAPRRNLADNLVIAILALNAADFLIRPTVTILIEGQIDVAAYHESIYFSLINLVLSVKAVATATVLFGACISDYLTRLKESALHDDLTGLKSRAAFEDEARNMMKRGQDEAKPVALVVTDIDHFKQVNDIWGHQAGDTAIINFGDLLEGTIRGCDVSARIGGEEFCLVVWNCGLDDAARLAERIRFAFAQMEHRGVGSDIRLTASFGVAEMQKGERYESLFSRADAALYRAKEEGRNQVVKEPKWSSKHASSAEGRSAERRVA